MQTDTDELTLLRREIHSSLIDAYNQMSRDQDRTVLTLSGGALVLSIAFISDISPSPRLIWVLVFAWLAFALSVLAVVFSYPTAKAKATYGVERLTEELRSGTFAQRTEEEASPWTRRWNLTALAALVGGLVLLVVFATANVV